MEKFKLNAELRNSEEKVKELRRSKLIPAVVYGHKQEALSLKLDNSEFLKVFREAWENHIIELNIESKNIDVLVHEIQRNPITDDFNHIDFHAIVKGEKVQTHIPFAFVWDSPAQKEWCIIEQPLKELEIKCLPKDLIDNFEIDLSKLVKEGDAIRVKNLDIDSSKYTIVNSENDLIAMAEVPGKRNEIEEEESVNEVEETSEEK